MARPRHVRDTCIFRLVAWDFKRFGMYLLRPIFNYMINLESWMTQVSQVNCEF